MFPIFLFVVSNDGLIKIFTAILYDVPVPVAARLLRFEVESHRGGRAWMFVVSVVCCQVEVFATG
jgi:hypothetical protein